MVGVRRTGSHFCQHAGFGHRSLDPATEPGHCLQSLEEMKTPEGTWLSSGSEAGQPGLWTRDQIQTQQWPLLRLVGAEASANSPPHLR